MFKMHASKVIFKKNLILVSNNILNFISICTQDQCFDERELRFLTERKWNTVRKSSQGYDASHKFYRRTVWYRSTSQMFKRQNNSRYNWNEKNAFNIWEVWLYNIHMFWISLRFQPYIRFTDVGSFQIQDFSVKFMCT